MEKDSSSDPSVVDLVLTILTLGQGRRRAKAMNRPFITSVAAWVEHGEEHRLGVALRNRGPVAGRIASVRATVEGRSGMEGTAAHDVLATDESVSVAWPVSAGDRVLVEVDYEAVTGGKRFWYRVGYELAPQPDGSLAAVPFDRAAGEH
jgi:hypothetical protein